MTAPVKVRPIGPAISDEPPGPEVVAAMRIFFAPFEEMSPALPDRIIGFMLTGVDAAILSEVEGNRAMAAQCLHLDSSRFKDEGVKQRFASHSAMIRFAWSRNRNVAFRLSRIFALKKDDIHARTLRRVDGQPEIPQWLHVFVRYFQMTPELEALDVSIDEIEHFCMASDVPLVTLLHYLYRTPQYPADKTGRKTLNGIRDFLRRHEAPIAALAPTLPEPQTIALLQDIGRYGLTSGRFLDLALDAALTPAKEATPYARLLVKEAEPATAMPALMERLRSGDAACRRSVVDLLGELGTDEAICALKEHAKCEMDSRVLAVVKRAEQAVATRRMLHVHADKRALPPGAKAVPMIDGDVVVVPPVERLERIHPLGPDQEAMLRAACHSYNAALRSCRESHPSKAVHRSEITDERVDALVKYVADGNLVPGPHGRPPTFAFGYHFYNRYNRSAEWPGYDGSLIDRFLAGEFSLVQAARLAACSLTGGSDHRPGFLSQLTLDDPEDKFLTPLARQVHADGDVRAALGELAALGVTPREQLYRLLTTQGAPVLDPMPASMFHLMLEHLDLFEEALGARPRSGEATLDTQHGLDILALFPKIPASLAPALIALGLTGHKKLRKRPRALIAAATGLDSALITQLVDADKKVRAEAATWIGERRVASAEADLRKALKAEKGEEGRAAMLTALFRIGADISDEFSEKKLKAEAEKGLASGAKSLAWFPFEAVPSLRWRTGKAVPAEVVKWWIVLAEKLKNPAGNALFDLYLDRLREDDAATLGVFLLRTFIARDTSNCGEEEAAAYAKRQADGQQQSWTRWQQSNPAQAALRPFDYHRVFAQAKAQILSIFPNSCSENRGFLAFSVRAPGPEAAELVRRYLKDNGHKVNQCKALLTALARNPASAAIQAVLAAANRLKQKSTQALAAELVEAIAEDRGWTADELADRTIPTGGFDEHGEMALDCGGDRVITAKYCGNGRIDLLNAGGKTVKALPAARGDQDKEAVTEAKKALASARKEVKQVESLQQPRLYEAMCVERSWLPDIWETHVKAHPIVGRMCQRLVWLALDGEDRLIATFRPLDDGSLSNNTDEPVSLDGAIAVKLAHDALLAPDEVKAWTAHLADYEITPLFAQFGQGQAAIVPPEDATEIRYCEGWMIDNLKLASVTGKRGYERGEVGDGGGFTEYVKRFEGARIRAALRFTGSYVGATETFPCALEAMSFQRIRPGVTRSSAPVRMSEVPKVLLAECIGDLVAFAVAGSGFDADWRRKSDY